MKVKFANRIYEVLFTKELAGLTMYAVEDEPNHIDWLINVEVVDAEKKELKKIEQPKQEWSEEDETMFVNLVAFLEGLCGTPEGGTKTYAEWLKERYKYALPMPHWKPSDEQMVSLARASNRCVSVDDANVLIKLLEQLEEL